jgi:hypothetical protein
VADDKSIEKAFDVSVDTRKLEIQLFWSRSLFFWGFISAAFVGYAALRRIESDLSLIVACFGFVCSVAWSLVNRGSKYWQESWESKVERLEPSVTGPLFACEEPEQLRKGCWLRGRRYSVSKLAIGLSDYAVFLWAAIIAWDLARIFVPPHVLPWLRQAGVIVFVAISIGFMLLLLIYGRTSPRNTNGT